MKTILASVYAVNPYKGSEDGTGWNLILQIARFNKVIAVTRENNRPHIERYLLEFEVPEAVNIRFLYFDLPHWLRFWKRGGKNALLYYYCWQLALPGFVRRQHLSFDIVHNLNFHSDWTPSFLWRLRKPLVWGPAGHHPQIPSQFILPVYGRKKWFMDRLRWQAKKMFWRLDPFLARTKKKAVRILAINTDVNRQLQVPAEKIVLMPAVATNDMQGPRSDRNIFQVISVGRFVALKGFDITIRSFAAFLDRLNGKEKDKARLILVGNGPELPCLRSMIADLGLTGHVEIILWVDRAEMAKWYSNSTVFFFPSHEGAGMVVPEALSCSLPVICFDNAGPGEFITEDCGLKIPYQSYQKTIEAFSTALMTLYTDPSLLARLGAGARDRFLRYFQWDQKGDILKEIYDQIA